MSSVSMPVTRPTGRALLVGSADCRQKPLGLLEDIGLICVEADDPYSAMVELSRRPQGYRALILSLAGVYREELSLIATVKRRFPQVEVWLTDIDGRQASLADAMGLGADGLLGNDGLHRVVIAAPTEAPVRSGGSKRHGKSGRSRRNRAHRASGESAARPAGAPPILAASPAPPSPKPVAPQASSTVPTGPTGSTSSPHASSPPPVPGRTPAPRLERSGNGAAVAGAPKHSRTDVYEDLDPSGEPVLTAEELRALLHEQPDESTRK